jgi:hypothetical protein
MLTASRTPSPRRSSDPAILARWLLEQEALAMLRRIARVKPFALQETMLPAAGLMPATLIAIERYLINDRRKLREQVDAFIQWLRSEGGIAEPPEVQRRLTFLRLRFNAALTQLEVFSEAISQRSESDTGVWLSGLDVAAQDALRVPGGYLEPPPILCYVHRGLGGAIRRARTRLPGGGENPAAVIRIPRERMIGFGIASSLVHEVGHQGAALLDLVGAARTGLQLVEARAQPHGRSIWQLWERWLSEIVADFWAIARVGISSTLGLMSIVSLPRAFVFRISEEDPHPFPWIRVMLSCAVGDSLYPHPQWRQLEETWEALYPLEGLDPARRQIIDELNVTLPTFVELLCYLRPRSLHGRSLAEVLRLEDRAPAHLTAVFHEFRARPALMYEVAPTLVFATFGRARVTGMLSPDEEDRLLGELISHWALASTLDLAEMCAVEAPAGVRLPSSMRRNGSVAPFKPASRAVRAS